MHTASSFDKIKVLLQFQKIYNVHQSTDLYREFHTSTFYKIIFYLQNTMAQNQYL